MVVSRPSSEFLVIWLNRLLTALQQNDTEWISSQDKEIKHYPKHLKETHYFMLNALSKPYNIHMQNLILLQPILPLKIIRVVFHKLCSSFPFPQIDTFYTSLTEQVSNILKQPMDHVCQNVYASIEIVLHQHEPFLQLSNSLYSWNVSNTSLLKTIGHICGNSIYYVALALFLSSYISKLHEPSFFLYHITQIERSLRHMTPLQTAFVFREASNCSIVRTYNTAFSIYLKQAADRFINEAECIHLLTEMCQTHTLSDWTAAITHLNPSIRCIIKQYLEYVTSHMLGEFISFNDPLVDDKLTESAVRYKTNQVLLQNKHHLTKLLARESCLPLKTGKDSCDNIIFSYQALSYLEEMEKYKCGSLYGTKTDFFKLSKFHCTSCISNYKTVCNQIKACTLNNHLSVNQHMLDTIYQCMYMRIIYKHQCVNIADANHDQQIHQQDNAIQKCMTIIDKQTGKAN